MTFEEIMTDLKNKIYKPVYLLMGEETYYIDEISNFISTNVLTESEKTFNQVVMYGRDTEVVSVINAARRFPMMSNHQVIILKEAQDLKKFEDMVYYVDKPLKSTILVICYKYKSLDKRKKVYDAFKKNGVIFESKKLYENQIPDWISSYLKKNNYTIEPNAVRLLTEFLGTDLGKIANELNKLIITLPSDVRKIVPEHIEKNIGFSKDYNNFELHKALTNKDVLKANRIINYFGKNPGDNPLTVTITSLYFFYAKVLQYHFLPDKSKNNVASVLRVNPFFVTDYENTAKKYPIKKVVEIISYLREYDLKSKGMGNSSTSESDLLKELVFKIIH
jgi:DNA polymerase III subunit delta